MALKVILDSACKMMIPIIKVVGDFCNLQCRYCFYSGKDQSTPSVMTDELLEKFIFEYLNLFSGNLIFIWHGGEPLLAGLPFFRKIIELQNKHRRNGQVIKNNIQTNGTLITDEWAQYFKEHNFKVGISVDGAKKSHNYFRVNSGGSGSFERVIKGVETLRRHGIEPGFIQTLAHDHLDNAKENFDFFANVIKTKGWGVNTYFDIDGLNTAMLNQSITNEELTKFLKFYIDSWLAQDDAHLRIREIDNLFAGAIGKEARNCTFNGSCTNYFCLEYTGQIYPCDRFSKREDLMFGDLSKQKLQEILTGPVKLKYAEDVNSTHPDCAACEWKNACHNGCTHHRVGGVTGKYYYCETRKTIFSYLKTKLENYKKTTACEDSTATSKETNIDSP